MIASREVCKDMEDTKESISCSIDDGSYFTEAYKWYTDIFIRPVVVGSLMRLISYAAIVCLIFGVYVIYTSFPIITTTNVIAFLPSTLHYEAKVSPLKQSGSTIREDALIYLANKYIKAREEYVDAVFFKPNYYFVQRSSEVGIFDSYYAMLIGDNSPWKLFQQGIRSEVRIVNSRYDDKYKRVYINFEKAIIDNRIREKAGDDSSEQLQWQAFNATLDVYMSQYDFNHSVNQSIEFIVTSYIVEAS